MMRNLSRGARALAVALVVAAVALASGFALKTSVETSSTAVTLGGASSQVPQGWTVAPGGGELAFTAANPADSREHYGVWSLPGSGVDVESEAHAFVELALLGHEALTLTRQGATTLAARPAYELRYVYLDANAPAALIRGVAWVANVGDTVLAVTYEATEEDFQRSVQRFQGLAASASVAPQ